ncbi:MAG: hypothetical protein IKB04_03315 [Clostridia bacterium]|nr:hypothetical protein [Clostridia bacterium]
MQKRYYGAVTCAIGATIVLLVLRLNGASVAALCVAAVAAVATFLLCGIKPRESRSVTGGLATVTAALTAVTGMALAVSALTDGLDLLKGIYPYPQPLTLTVMSKILLFLLIGGGIGGGAVLAVIGVRWFFNRTVDRTQFVGVALLPVVWMWARLIWYMTSFTSAINRFRSLNEVALLLFEMLFLLVFARYVSGVEEKTPRFAVPIALCTGILGVSACVTRVASLVMQNTEVFDATSLIAAPDFAVALLAAAWAVGQLFGEGEAVPPLPEEEEEAAEEDSVEEQPENEEEPSFLLNEDDLAESEESEEDDEVVPEEKRKPLELEEIINEILNGER